MKVIGVIPARYQSTRLPHKPLVPILGKPLILHVLEQASKAKSLDGVIVATDHPEIERVVKGAGGKAVMTGDHASGTDRIAEVSRHLDAEVIVNIQGDEPLMAPEMIDQAVEPFRRDPVQMATLAQAMTDAKDLANPHAVKVVVNSFGYALYFSRAPIPFPFGAMMNPAGTEQAGRGGAKFLKHIGLYVYRKDFLQMITKLPRGALEQTEQLEQLRVLEYGYNIRVVETAGISVGVDTPEDIKTVEGIMRGRGV